MSPIYFVRHLSYRLLDAFLDKFYPLSNAFHLSRKDFRAVREKFRKINAQAPGESIKIKMRKA